jgi:hypothetical protein
VEQEQRFTVRPALAYGEPGTRRLDHELSHGNQRVPFKAGLPETKVTTEPKRSKQLEAAVTTLSHRHYAVDPGQAASLRSGSHRGARTIPSGLSSGSFSTSLQPPITAARRAFSMSITVHPA